MQRGLTYFWGMVNIQFALQYINGNSLFLLQNDKSYSNYENFASNPPSTLNTAKFDYLELSGPPCSRGRQKIFYCGRKRCFFGSVGNWVVVNGVAALLITSVSGVPNRPKWGLADPSLYLTSQKSDSAKTKPAKMRFGNFFNGSAEYSSEPQNINDAT